MAVEVGRSDHLRRYLPLAVALIILWTAPLIGCLTPGGESTPSSPLFHTPTVLPSTIPTPSSGKGVVFGTLRREGTNEPLHQVDIYLAGLLSSTEGEKVLAVLDVRSDPWAFSDERGSFLFVDVPPDTYGLVIVCPTGSFLLRHPDTGGDFFITVEAGEQLDLGVLHIPEEICGG